MMRNKEQYIERLVREYKAACNEVEFHWRNLQLNDRPTERYRALLHKAMLQCELEVVEREMLSCQ